jgi:hypothetical protein
MIKKCLFYIGKLNFKEMERHGWTNSYDPRRA